MVVEDVTIVWFTLRYVTLRCLRQYFKTLNYIFYGVFVYML